MDLPPNSKCTVDEKSPLTTSHYPYRFTVINMTPCEGTSAAN